MVKSVGWPFYVRSLGRARHLGTCRIPFRKVAASNMALQRGARRYLKSCSPAGGVISFPWAARRSHTWGPLRWARKANAWKWCLLSRGP